MTPRYTPRAGSRPAHRRRRRSRESERRLRALGTHTPSLPPEELRTLAHEQARRVMVRAIVTVVAVLVVAVAGLQWFRPVPSPVFEVVAPRPAPVPGAQPLLNWPGSGTATVELDDAGALSSFPATAPVPMGGLAKVMVAYVVLEDHPLGPGGSGPTVPVTPSAVAEYRAALAAGQSVVPVVSGESLTELQALQGVLVASGNNMVALLAGWSAGSVPAFVAEMNAAARRLGMRHTTFLDPSGVAAGSVTTPADMVRLARAAMAVPAFRAIVDLPQVTLPTAGLVYNLDYDLGRDGFVGIKAGSDATAGGCFLFETQEVVDGRTVTLEGALLGLQAPSPTDDALDDADALAREAFAVLRPFTAVASGAPVGRIVAPWGASVPVVTAGAATFVGWSSLVVAFRVDRRALPARALAAGTRVGSLAASLGDEVVPVDLRTEGRLAGPSVMWKLTRL